MRCIAEHNLGQSVPRDQLGNWSDGHLRAIELDQQEVACRCPGDGVRLRKPGGSIERDLTACTRDEIMDPVHVGVLKVVLVATEDHLDSRPLKERDQRLENRTRVVVRGTRGVGRMVHKRDTPGWPSRGRAGRGG